MDLIYSLLYPKSREALEYDAYVTKCQKAKDVSDLKEILAFLEPICKEIRFFSYKTPFNKYIGWGLPSNKSIEAIYTAFQSHLLKYPDAKLVDLGAGTGHFSALLVDRGIPTEKVVAIDFVPDKRTHQTCKEYYKITLPGEYEILPQDVILVVWGVCVGKNLDDYAAKGGSCVIIQGESDGCTFTTQYFQDKEGWSTVIAAEQLPSLASLYMEELTVNTRYL